MSFWAVTQQAEWRTVNSQVVGSIPTSPAKGDRQ
jgi:hypothetical protein